jgi:hypothetical protein
VTVVGAMVATAALLDESVTVSPPAGAGLESVTGTDPVAPGASVIAPMLRILLVTVVLPVAEVNPAPVAVIVALPDDTPVMLNVQLLPAGQITDAGTVADADDMLNEIVVEAASGGLKLSVAVLVPPIGVSDATDSVIVPPPITIEIGVPAIVTTPSFTVTETTYVPGRSGVKLLVAAVLLDNAEALPTGRLVIVQANVSASPLASVALAAKFIS